MKYSFKLEDGRKAIATFKHTGRRKGKSPKGTICRIIVDNEIIAQSWSKPVTEIAVIDNEPVKAGMMPTTKFVKKIKTVNGVEIFIYKGDKFSKSEGRTVSFLKAVKILSTRNQNRAIVAMIKQGVIASAVIEYADS